MYLLPNVYCSEFNYQIWQFTLLLTFLLCPSQRFNSCTYAEDTFIGHKTTDFIMRQWEPTSIEKHLMHCMRKMLLHLFTTCIYRTKKPSIWKPSPPLLPFPTPLESTRIHPFERVETSPIWIQWKLKADMYRLYL